MTRTTDSTPEADRSPGEPAGASVASSVPEPPLTRERIRELIQAEVDKQAPLENSRRAAALLAETSVRFVDEPGTSGFVIEGPDGRPRTIVRDGQTVPFTLPDLAAEVRRKYPALFKPDGPDGAAPAVQSEQPETSAPARDWLMLASGEPEARVPADTGIPPEVSIAAAPTGTPIEPGISAEPAQADPGARLRAALNSAGSWNLRAWTEKWRNQPVPASRAEAPEPNTALAPDVPIRTGFRPSYALYAAALLAFCGILALIVSDPGSQAPSNGAATQQARTGSEPRPASTATIPQPEAPAARAPRPRDAIAGAAEVVDTSTLRVDGKVVRLFGVEWARGGQAEDLTRYIAGREVVCTPAVRSDRHRCQIEGRDVSEVVLYNGGARATPEATPELKAAEAHARAAGLGVWQKP